MIYQVYQTHADMMMPLRTGAKTALAALSGVGLETLGDSPLRKLAAAYELISRTGLSHKRPPYGIDCVTVENRQVQVVEEAVHVTPFGTLLHFKKDIVTEQPRVLLVAPMSGHFATLLRNTVRTMLPDHDVYITDWHNARDVPLSAGRFGLEDYTEHLITFMEVLGPGAHMVAICQPSVSALAAAAVMAEDDNPARPLSLTLMAGPIDCRILPTQVDEFATTHPLSWFEQNLIDFVPFRHPGAFRRVYPGFLQLTGFLSMNIDRHVKSHIDLYNNLAKGEIEKAEAIRTFYDEYFAVMDLTAEFFLETVRDVFQEFLLPQGKLPYRGRLVNPGAIRRMTLMTVEGENDDICSIGQTMAAQELCTGIRPYRKHHHVQTGVGHYGVFSGRRWNNEIYPRVRDMIQISR